MKTEVVYEIINDSLNPYLIVPFFITVVILILLIISFIIKKTLKVSSSQVVGIIVFIAFTSLSIYNIFKIKQYNEILDDYEKGNYEIVEGFIEDYLPISEEKNTDSFKVDNIEFILPNNIGYKLTSLTDSHIKGDGQFVRIGYVTINGLNYIIRLEVNG